MQLDIPISEVTNRNCKLISGRVKSGDPKIKKQ